ncbi:hypothetical protein MHSWG343_05650 [Candidatus Mycoplasma haematohominis]|uniref:Uncharacterized protein n=1 Tax=Candidatus Mycoplasma haematohominis TaxID=1494318 RepID=A0A478FPX7_9MOLU|nr:hypothetical protein MHSWG343_05650 [Candidatus Mycoplasma haemohominis]
MSDLSTEFKTVASGYDASSSTALNKVCEARYKEDKSKFPDSSTTDSNDNKHKLKRNVESFCVRGGQGNLTIPTN